MRFKPIKILKVPKTPVLLTRLSGVLNLYTMKETELAQYFIEYLSCYDLYFEVGALSGCVDIVALSGKIMIAYEVKTSFNFKVIEQAVGNKQAFHYSYVCVPYAKDNYFQIKICEDYGIGVLVYNQYGRYNIKHDILEKVPAKLNRHAITKHNRLHEYQKRSIAGCASSGDRITPFKITVENMLRFVRVHPGCTIKEMMSGISHHYGSDKAAISTTYQWLNKGVIKGIELKDRKLYRVFDTVSPLSDLFETETKTEQN